MKEEAKNRKKAREKQSELKTMKIGLKISDNEELLLPNPD